MKRAAAFRVLGYITGFVRGVVTEMGEKREEPGEKVILWMNVKNCGGKN